MLLEKLIIANGIIVQPCFITKKLFYLVTKKIVTKKRIRQIVKQLLSYKNKTKNKEILSDDRTGAKTFDEFFLNVVQS